MAALIKIAKYAVSLQWVYFSMFLAQFYHIYGFHLRIYNWPQLVIGLLMLHTDYTLHKNNTTQKGNKNNQNSMDWRDSIQVAKSIVLLLCVMYVVMYHSFTSALLSISTLFIWQNCQQLPALHDLLVYSKRLNISLLDTYVLMGIVRGLAMTYLCTQTLLMSVEPNFILYSHFTAVEFASLCAIQSILWSLLFLFVSNRTVLVRQQSLNTPQGPQYSVSIVRPYLPEEEVNRPLSHSPILLYLLVGITCIAILTILLGMNNERRIGFLLSAAHHLGLVWHTLEFIDSPEMSVSVEESRDATNNSRKQKSLNITTTAVSTAVADSLTTTTTGGAIQGYNSEILSPTVSGMVSASNVPAAGKKSHHAVKKSSAHKSSGGSSKNKAATTPSSSSAAPAGF